MSGSARLAGSFHMLRKLLLVALLLVPGIARAEWREASSTNFVVISNESEKSLRARVEALEKFGLVLQALTGARRPKEQPVRVRLYFVDTSSDVRETMPFPVANAAGYYTTSIRGPLAVMPRIELDDGPLALTNKTILQHELTHHFMYQYFPGAYPSWYREGIADYAGMIEIGRNNVTRLGLVSNHRVLTTRYVWVPLKKLLLARTYSDLGNNMIALYSQGWVLVHYLNSTPEGKAQLAAYLAAINRGESFEKAAEAFGDLDAFDRTLYRYAHRQILPATELRWESLDPGPVTIRALSGAEAALIRADIALTTGVSKARVQDFAAEVRRTAARFPGDPWALRILTEAERLAGNHDQALAVASRWAAAAPGDGLALMHKGELELRALKSAGSTDAAAWAAARAQIVAAAKLTPTPQVLKAYYDSFATQGRTPPVAAQNALMAALDALPQDNDLRYRVALDFEQRGMIEDAVNTIRPLAYAIRSDDELSPKQKAKEERDKARFAIAGDEDTETPREMLARLEKKLAEEAAPPAAD